MLARQFNIEVGLVGPTLVDLRVSWTGAEPFSIRAQTNLNQLPPYLSGSLPPPLPARVYWVMEAASIGWHAPQGPTVSLSWLIIRSIYVRG